MSEMNWLQEFEEDIVALAQAPGEMAEFIIQNAEVVREILAPLLDGSVDPGDVDAVDNAWWDKFGPKELERARKEVTIQRRLARLYERLEYASSEELEAYARATQKLRLESMVELLGNLIPPPPTSEDPNEDPSHVL
jgi:hypothetical protein